MEKMHTEPSSVADLEVHATPRKAWHAPAVRWLDVRKTQSGWGGALDGNPSSSSSAS